MKTIVLVIAWTWIAVPLGWGVFQSVQKCMPLFSGPFESAAETCEASQALLT